MNEKNEQKVLCTIWLQETVRMNSRRAQVLLGAFGSPEEVWKQGDQTLIGVGRLAEGEGWRLSNRSLEPAQEILNKCKAKGIQVLPIWDERYPNRLREINDPPLVLYARGILPDWNHLPMIAVVGQRKATAYGKMNAEKMGFQLSRSGVCVVSGMAAGVDAAAHRGALQGNAPTVAVFGTAIDQCYPAENKELLQEILKHGAAISEYPPGKQGYASYFPRRNRIISGISLGVVVVEAPIKSGSLITAGQAMEQGRDVFAIPGGVDSITSAGCNELIVNGAKLVRYAGDVLNEYSKKYHFSNVPEYTIEPPGDASDVSVQPAPVQPAEKPKKASDTAKKKTEAQKSAPSKAKKSQTSAKSGNAASFAPTNDPVLAIMDGPLTLSEISRRTGISIPMLMGRLSMLELSGKLRQLPGQIYERIG